MWTVEIRDQTAHSVQSYLNLHCPQKLLVSSSVRRKLTILSRNVHNIMQSKFKSINGFKYFPVS